MRPLLLALLVACDDPASADPDATPPPPDAATPSPWTATPEGAPIEPALDPPGVERAMAEALLTVRDASNAPVAAAFAALMALADDTCPGVEEVGEGIIYFEADCATADGVGFRGTAQYTAYADLEEEDGWIRSGFELDLGDGIEISTPDGRFLRGAGYLAEARGVNGRDRDVYGYRDGSLLADEQTAAGDPWLLGRQGTLTAYRGSGQAWHYTEASGSFAHAASTWTAVLLEELVIRSESDCPQEPEGGLSLRDVNGIWHDVVFDTECDGCGSLWSAGQPAGQVCLSAEALAAFLEGEQR